MIASISTRALLRTVILAGLTTLNAACTAVGPDYVRPAVDVPQAYKEAVSSDALPPPDASIQDGWWRIYGDNELNALVEQVETSNQAVQGAEARARQAQALLEIAKAGKDPTVMIGGTNDLGLRAGWEVDLWGRIRRNIEASGATAQASTADLAAATLSIQAQLVQNYFLLRLQDTWISLLEETVTAYERSLQITRNQYAVGVAARGNVVQAQAQLGATQAQLQDAKLARAQMEHAIAVLTGKAPASFSLAAGPFDVSVPEVPPGLPSELLKRRPDIAAAERRMAAASAQIGATEAANRGSLELFAGVSIDKGLLGGSVLSVPVSPVAVPRARSAKATAAYDEAVSDYRQSVLNGFLEVEDNLAALQILGTAAAAQSEAVNSARESVRIAKNQYRAGIIEYLPVVVLQAGAVNNERAALDILSRRLLASVNLIKALGGGWDPATMEPVPQSGEHSSD